MKRIALVNLALMISCGVAFAQDWRRIAPKTPAPKPPLSELPKPSTEAATPATEQVIITNLNGLVIVPSLSAIKPEGIPGVSGLQIQGPSFLRVPDFQKIVKPYFGQVMSFSKIKKLQRDIILFCRAKDHPVIDVFLPEQDPVGGVIQMAVLEGRLGKIVVTNEPPVWFDHRLIRQGIRLRPGDPIRESRLLEDLNWLNRNSYFRDVEVKFKQGAFNPTGPSDVDLQLDVTDRLPVSAYGGYENSGNRLLGENRFLLGANFGDVFHLDHQFNYQFTIDTEGSLFRAHSASYVVPLPWRHTLTVFGSVVNVHADLSSVGFSGFNQEGHSYQASLRYGVPLPKIMKYDHEVFAGFDYKRTDNNIEFGGSTVFNTPTEIDQVVLGYRGLLSDRYGFSSIGAQGYYSPGGLTEHNDAKSFNQTRPGAKPDYIYAQVTGERVTKLPLMRDWKEERVEDSFTWAVRGTLQFSDGPLLPSEQLGVGGYASVRGYEERLANGDDGWIINNELRTPSFKIGNLLGEYGHGDGLQFLAFMDYGAVRANGVQTDLLSVGPGLRYRMSRNFFVRFDYGFQLLERNLSTKNSRAHVGVLLSF